MNRILIDTNIYTAFKLGTPSVVSVLRFSDFIGIDITVVGELLAGFSGGKRNEENKKSLAEFIDSPRVHLITHDYNTAEYYSVIYGQLRRKARPIPTNDLWIAACALSNGLALYTQDAHFNGIEGLTLANQ